jgi:invasion protein IalB
VTSIRTAAVLLTLAALACVPASAQAPKKGAAAAPAPAHAQTPGALPSPEQQAAQPPVPGWVSRCSSASRETPLECAVEETAVLTKTGQLIVLVNIRVTSDTRQPVALVQLPLGLNLPAGAKL